MDIWIINMIPPAVRARLCIFSFARRNPRRYYHGLLSGVDNVKDAQFFSANLSDADFLRNRSGYLLEAANRDNNRDLQKYLDLVSASSTLWPDRNAFFGREEVLSEVEAIASDRGNFAYLLGGKSTGKSTLMNWLKDKEYAHVVVVDMREVGRNTSLAAAVLRELGKEGLQKHYTEFWSRFAEAIGSTDPMDIYRGVKVSLERITEALAAKSESEAGRLSFVVSVLSTLSRPVVLVIDEADIAFDSTDALPYLEVFTKFTKQDRKVSVILCSSDYTFPFRLEEMKFNNDNLTKLMFMGEVSPAQMHSLLTAEWRVGEHLAIAMIECFGGHIWNHHRAIKSFARQKEKFNPVEFFGVSAPARVLDCLRRFRGEQDKHDEMLQCLCALAEKGFVPVDGAPRSNEVCEVLSSTNVAGLVTNLALVSGLPETVWPEGVYYGLVPSSQSMRLVIAEQLTLDKRQQAKK